MFRMKYEGIYMIGLHILAYRIYVNLINSEKSHLIFTMCTQCVVSKTLSKTVKLPDVCLIYNTLPKQQSGNA